MSPDDYKVQFGAGRKQGAFGGGTGRFGAYDAGRAASREMASWHPPHSWVNTDVLANRDKVTDRARDMARNHPIISGAIDRKVEAAVGPALRLEAQPDFEAMGRSPEWADDWATNVEAQFRVWANDYRFLADVEMTNTFGGLMELAYRHWWVDGEVLIVVKMLPRGGAWETCIQVIDPDRLSNPNGIADNMVLANGNRVIGGVEIHPDGWPVAYHVRAAHPAEYGRADGDTMRWERVARFGPTGSPRAIHAFKSGVAGQRKGISRFVAAIKRMKMFDRYDDAEIEAALLNAVMAAFMESPMPTGDVQAAIAPGSNSFDGESGWSFDQQLAYRMENSVRIAGAQVIHGLPGEKLTFQTAERPSANYPDFQATGLRSLAANFGLSYAQVSQNWADINYSSARAMLNEIWRGLLHDRASFTAKVATPVYAAWLEETVALGRVKVPGGPLNFYRWRPELTACEWKGPGRGTIDPLKEAQANELELNAGTTNLAMIADDIGADHRKVLLGRARDKALRERLGLDPWVPLKGGQGPQAQPDNAQPAGAEA